MKVKNTILQVRLTSELHAEMLRSIERFNKNSFFELNQSGFIRLAVKVLTQMILTGQKIPVEFKANE